MELSSSSLSHCGLVLGLKEWNWYAGIDIHLLQTEERVAERQAGRDGQTDTDRQAGRQAGRQADTDRGGDREADTDLSLIHI